MKKKNPEKISINIGERLYYRLEKLMGSTGLRPTDIVRNALDEYLQKRDY